MSKGNVRTHNEKWLRRYHGRAELRDRYPDEFKRLREETSYVVALRLIEEAHPGEIPIEPTRPKGKQATGMLRCTVCGEPLRDHSLTSRCRP